MLRAKISTAPIRFKKGKKIELLKFMSEIANELKIYIEEIT